MIIGHAVADADGIILAADENVCDLLQRSRREIVDSPYRGFIDPEDRVTTVSAIDRLPANASPLIHRMRLLKANGRRSWVEMQVSRFMVGSDAGRLVATFQWIDPGCQTPGATQMWRSATAMLRFICTRRKLLGSDLNPEYDLTILIHAYLAEIEGRNVTCRGICDDADLPLAIGRRWLHVLVEHCLLCPVAGVDDPLQLTDLGNARIERILATLQTD